jgi:hypothetical protein
VAADHQHGHVVTALAEGLEELQAVHLGHLDIEDHRVRRALRHPGEGLVPSSRLLHPVSLVLQDHVEAVADRCLVVHYQDSGSNAVGISGHW